MIPMRSSPELSVPKAAAISYVPLLAIGDLLGRVRDPFGNIWWLQTHVEDVSEKEMAKRGAEPKWAKAMEYMQTSLVGGLSGVCP
jgi:PhnB protein